MALVLLNRQALGNINDLTTPTATAQYPIGYEVSLMDTTTGYLKKFMYIKNLNGTTAIKTTVTVGVSGTAGSELVAVVPATSSVYILAGVANTAVPANYYFFLQTYGDTSVISAGNTTAGNTAKLANGVSTATDEAGATETAKSIGVLKTTQSAGSATVSIFLLGKRITI